MTRPYPRRGLQAPPSLGGAEAFDADPGRWSPDVDEHPGGGRYLERRLAETAGRI